MESRKSLSLSYLTYPEYALSSFFPYIKSWTLRFTLFSQKNILQSLSNYFRESPCKRNSIHDLCGYSAYGVYMDDHNSSY